MLISDTGEVVAVDWPEACGGAPWFDLVLALPSFALPGADPKATVIATSLALCTHGARYAHRRGRGLLHQPLPAATASGLSTVRDFQRRQAVAALQWPHARDDTTRQADVG
jgi:aminoglycoside phosphotransferase (APT) family kinase protein